MFRFNRSINSPVLSEMDINYFKYKLYNYDKLQINCITRSIIKEINNLNKINDNFRRKRLFNILTFS